METYEKRANNRADDLAGAYSFLETLRAHKRLEAVPGPVKDMLPMETPRQFWQRLQRLLTDDREQRLVYLLYHCGLRPAEIVHLCPQEWSDVREVIRLRAIILKRLLVELPLIAEEAAQNSS
jgi:integrase